MSLLSYCLCLKCYELFLFSSSDRQELGRQLVEACRFAEWKKAISLLEKGEWTRAERHSVHKAITVFVAQQSVVSAHVTSSHSYVTTSSHSYKFHLSVLVLHHHPPHGRV